MQLQYSLPQQFHYQIPYVDYCVLSSQQFERCKFEYCLSPSIQYETASMSYLQTAHPLETLCRAPKQVIETIQGFYYNLYNIKMIISSSADVPQLVQ
jgi:hypothetical protein